MISPLDDNAKLTQLFLDLIAIADSFDQLGKIAAICDRLYHYSTPEHKDLFNALEKTALHLKSNRTLGINEVRNEK